MHIGIVGYGIFGKAIESLLIKNGHNPECVDVDEHFTQTVDIIFLAVPVQYMRSALQLHKKQIAQGAIFINCSKGIEKDTTALPQQIVHDIFGEESPYVVIAGPSFASEIMASLPTVVNIASTHLEAQERIISLLQTPWFVLEKTGTPLELELAGAMKNIYAVAAGYIAGSGGGQNIHAHLQVVALREYTTLIQALEGTAQVVRPAVAGDLFLTCASTESRNYQYGYMLAKDDDIDELTAEGVASADAMSLICQKHAVQLPLALATRHVVQKGEHAHDLLYQALGFKVGV